MRILQTAMAGLQQAQQRFAEQTQKVVAQPTDETAIAEHLLARRDVQAQLQNVKAANELEDDALDILA